MSNYVIGMRALASHRRAQSVIGAAGDGDIIYTDHATVWTVQEQLHALSVATSNAAFDPGKIDGAVGPHTNTAVAAFNKAYGWPTDGGNITAGTLEALKRPDVVNPKAAQSASAAADSASTPAEVQAAAAKLTAVANSPTTTALIHAAQQAAQVARTPAEVEAAKAQVKNAAAASQAVPWGQVAFFATLSLALGGISLALVHGSQKKMHRR